MPDRVTIYRWAATHPDFATRLEIAREALADIAAYEIGQIAASCTPEIASADRVRLAALQWRASRLAPRKYADRRATELVGSYERTIAVEGRAQQQAIDVSVLGPEERQILRVILKRMEHRLGVTGTLVEGS